MAPALLAVANSPELPAGAVDFGGGDCAGVESFGGAAGSGAEFFGGVDADGFAAEDEFAGFAGSTAAELGAGSGTFGGAGVAAPQADSWMSVAVSTMEPINFFKAAFSFMALASGDGLLSLRGNCMLFI